MGEYFDWVNVDKREYLCPCDFDLGNKLYESTALNNDLLGALCALSADVWRGDRLIWLGDYAEIPAGTENAALKCLAGQHAAWMEVNGNDTLYTFIDDAYRNVSPLFREAEKKVRTKIARMIEHGDFSGDEFKVDPADPFRGLFVRSVKHCRYVVNRGRGEFLDQEHDRSEAGCAGRRRSSYLPILFAYGETVDEPYAGLWIGDRVEFRADPPPDGYKDMSGVYKLQ